MMSVTRSVIMSMFNCRLSNVVFIFKPVRERGVWSLIH